MAVLGEYDVKVGNYGHATMSVIDFEGAEFLYAHGEATMGNGSGVVRLGGTELVSASTNRHSMESTIAIRDWTGTCRFWTARITSQ